MKNNGIKVLTQDIFKGVEDCIKSAAIQSDGFVMGFCCTKEHKKPRMYRAKGTWIKSGQINYTSFIIDSCYDPSEWETSIINRIVEDNGEVKVDAQE